MELEEIDVKLLNAIYEKDFNQETINFDYLGFESKHQQAFHLQRLERLGYITLESNVIRPGGMRDEKYKISVAYIIQDGIHIVDKGIKAIKEK